jgi:hypothetical protein
LRAFSVLRRPAQEKHLKMQGFWLPFLLQWHPMWPFRRRRLKKPKQMVETVVVGLIIGGAIGSIIGKKMLDKHDEDEHHKHGKKH